jgi:uncharacterized protein
MEEKIYQLLKEKKTDELLNLVDENPDLINFSDSNGVSLLLLGYYFGNTALTENILSKRVPSTIYEAVVAGFRSAVEKFLQQSPDLLEQHSSDGFTPLGLASYFRRTEIAATLLQRGANPNVPSTNAFHVMPLHSAVAANSLEISRLLLEAGANPDARQQKGITALHSAAHNGNVDIVKLLLAHGADPKVSSDDGKTARAYAQEVNAEKVVEMLSSF